MQEWFHELLADYPGDKQRGLDLIQQFMYEIPYEKFLQTEPLAAMTGDLVLNFSDCLSAEIRKASQAQAKVLAERIFEEWERERGMLFKPVENKIEENHNLSEVWGKWKTAQKEQLAYEASVKKEASKRPRFPFNELEAFIKPDEELDVIIPKEAENLNQPEPNSKETIEDQAEKSESGIPAADVIMSRLIKASKVLGEVPGFQKQAREFSARSESFQNQTYTLALLRLVSAANVPSLMLF